MSWDTWLFKKCVNLLFYIRPSLRVVRLVWSRGETTEVTQEYVMSRRYNGNKG
jgi:hypothetical protein